jgi:hypothetical protein
MSISDRLKEFIADEQNTALVLSGGWGEGKTYFWKDFAEKNAKNGTEHRKNYAYISLFGVNSLTDLRNALAVNIQSIDHMGQKTFLDSLDGGVEQTAAAARRGIGRFFRSQTSSGAGLSIPHASLGNVAPLYMAWAYHGVRDALICLDDIERRSQGLDLKDVLGLISDLVNERNCSVITILNDGSLDGNDLSTWNEFREKVFIGELRWYGTCDISLGYVYDKNTTNENDRMAIEAIRDLGISNIRIIQRIKMAIDQVVPKLPIDTLSETRKELIRGLAIISFVWSGQGCGAPPAEMLRRSQLLEDAIEGGGKQEGAKKNKTVAQKGWEDLLRRYGYYIDGRLDMILEKSVKDGYPDMAKLQVAVVAFDEDRRKYKRHEAIQAAWALYHDKVGDNSEEVISAIYKAVLEGVSDISAPNTSAAIKLLRDLGDDPKASDLIKAWIAARSTLRWIEFSPQNVEIFGQISDFAFKDAIDHAYKSALKLSSPDFEALIELVLNGQGFSGSSGEELGIAPVSAYVEYLQKYGLAIIKNMLSLPTQGPNWLAEVRNKTMSALSKIAHGSLIDRRRVTAEVGDIEHLWEKYPPHEVDPDEASLSDETDLDHG